jgi:hypothetical protein
MIDADAKSAGEDLARKTGIVLGRQKYHDLVIAEGGKPAVERIRKYGRTDEDEPIIMRQWFAEIVEAICDFRISFVGTTGCSQAGKTLSHILMSCDLLIHGQLSFGWFYYDKESRDKYSVNQWRPVAEAWIRAIEDELGGKSLLRHSDAQNASLWQCCGVSGNFQYASTSKSAPSRTGKAAIGARGASFKSNLNIEEERSQWPSGVDFNARLNAGIFSSTPRRPLGTPGSGAGIEELLKNCDRAFYPHYRCRNPDCRAEKPLDPRGCLLLPKDIVVRGKRRVSYFSRNYRPLDWWESEDGKPLFCCSECGTPLSEKQRTEDAWMRCTLTGVDWARYDRTDEKISMTFSPLCRENRDNLAEVLIRDGLDETKNARDWVQQDLGIPTDADADQLTVDQIRLAIGEDYPTVRPPQWIVAGLDCGRGQHWLWIQEVYPPPNWQKMSHADVLQLSVRRVVFAEPVHKDEIYGLLQQYGVTFGITDNEPERDYARNLCMDTAFQMADQKPGQLTDFELKSVTSGGEEMACWFINDEIYKARIIDNCMDYAFDHRLRYRFPASWEEHCRIKGENSPVRHLTAVSFDPVLQKWKRPADHIDDLFFAAMFAEAALAIGMDSNNPDIYAEW